MYAVDFLIEQHKMAHFGTERVFKQFPEEAYDWMPENANYTAGEMLFHLMTVNLHLVSTLKRALGREFEEPDMELAGSFEAELERYREMFYDHQEFLKTLDSESFDQPVSYPSGAETSTGELLHTLIAHEVHHRGQAHLYLKLYGLQQPTLWIY